ncbi:hypothetical protein GCM10009116_02340 [Brevundimonas basaltis]|uniref:Uncharacterized protein n=1 Tax=Brevundimonas basaltis TaxID=472166 RepID=A0A7W8HZ69_9CAUL|nr:hypothetical protein [Brevundimonas basaltis]MBB5292505.1 hypothetical protein [Brevundimonas basaltis]
MKFNLTAAFAAVCLALASAPAAAQEIDWGSETNRTWWNGVTEAELRELVAEAGGVWTDLPDEEDLRESRIDWPDLRDVRVREGSCPAPERPMAARNCAAMLVYVRVDYPNDIESWWLSDDGWLAFGTVDAEPALYRLEHHGYGTTRGHVLANLMMFRVAARTEIARLKDGGA